MCLIIHSRELPFLKNTPGIIFTTGTEELRLRSEYHLYTSNCTPTIIFTTGTEEVYRKLRSQLSAMNN